MKSGMMGGFIRSAALALMFGVLLGNASAATTEVFQQDVLALQQRMNDDALRAKLIKMAQEMTPGPSIPEQAEKFGNRAQYIIEHAKTKAEFNDAIKEYEKALLVAPWVAAYYYNLAAVFEKNGQLQEAIRNYKFYLLAEPNAQDAREVRKQIDGFEYAIEKEAAQKKLEEVSRVLIPAGEFKGSGSKVFVGAFYMDMYEVTVAQYRQFCEETGRKMPAAPSWGWQDDVPMVNVSWDDANAYAQHYGKRLPTKAEWEKAALAGSKTRYCFGKAENELKDYAWYAVNAGEQPHAVGTRKPNAFAIYDMHGNVAEWLLDWHDFNNYNNDTRNPPSGKYPQFLGGGWRDPAKTCAILAGFFQFIASGEGLSDVGFRCVASQ